MYNNIPTMGCCHSANIQIKNKVTEKMTIDELPLSKGKESDEKFNDADNDTAKAMSDFEFPEDGLLKSFKTQEFFYVDQDKEFTNVLIAIAQKYKR